jgi:hypothetical protein
VGQLPNDFLLHEDDIRRSRRAVMHYLLTHAAEKSAPSIDMIRAACFHLEHRERGDRIDTLARSVVEAAPSIDDIDFWSPSEATYNRVEALRGY